MELTVSNHKADVLIEAIKQLPQVQPVTTHHWDNGVYQRGMIVDAGVVVAGKVHKHAGLLTLVRGKALFFDGDTPRVVVAPWACVGKPGARRVVYSLEPCHWIAFVVTDETDPDKIEADTVEPELEDLVKIKGVANELVVCGSDRDQRGGDGRLGAEPGCQRRLDHSGSRSEDSAT